MNPVQMSKESTTLPTHAGRASSALSLLGAPRTRLAAASLARHYQADFTCVRRSQKRARASEEARREASGARSATQVRAWSWSLQLSSASLLSFALRQASTRAVGCESGSSGVETGTWRRLERRDEQSRGGLNAELQLYSEPSCSTPLELEDLASRDKERERKRREQRSSAKGRAGPSQVEPGQTRRSWAQ